MRKDLCPALRDLLQHGMLQTVRFILIALLYFLGHSLSHSIVSGDVFVVDYWWRWRIVDGIIYLYNTIGCFWLLSCERTEASTVSSNYQRRAIGACKRGSCRRLFWSSRLGHYGQILRDEAWTRIQRCTSEEVDTEFQSGQYCRPLDHIETGLKLICAFHMQ